MVHSGVIYFHRRGFDSFVLSADFRQYGEWSILIPKDEILGSSDCGRRVSGDGKLTYTSTNNVCKTSLQQIKKSPPREGIFDAF